MSLNTNLQLCTENIFLINIVVTTIFVFFNFHFVYIQYVLHMLVCMNPTMHSVSLFNVAISLCTNSFQIPQCKTNLLEMFKSKPLHLHHLVITGPVVEGVASLGEVVQHISGVKNRHQAAVHPGYPKKVVCTLDGKFNFNTYTSATCEVWNYIMVILNTFKACMEHGYSYDSLRLYNIY